MSPAPINSNSDVKSDGYDRGIIPAETAARIEREGENFKHMPEGSDVADADAIDTTGGYTMDREGLMNNYAVEPEMYYEEPGDLKEKEAALKTERQEQLTAINQTDESGKLRMNQDERQEGTGII